PATGAASGTVTQSTASSSSSSTGSASAAATSPSATATAAATGHANATHSSSAPKHTAGPQPSSNDGVTFPPIGTIVLIVQHSNLGFVMAEANGSVVYTYA